MKHSTLVGGFNPFEKYYIVKLDDLPQVGVKIKNIGNHQPALDNRFVGESCLANGVAQVPWKTAYEVE